MSMFQVIGIQNVNFTAPDGHQISGVRLHLIEEKPNVVGYSVESVFLGEQKLALANYIPALNDTVNVFWSRYTNSEGKKKVDGIQLVKKAQQKG